MFALGFCDPDGVVSISYGLFKDHIQFLLDNLFAVSGQGSSSVVCGAHYLVFDLGVLFWPVINPKGATADKAPRRAHFSYLSRQYRTERNPISRGLAGAECIEIEIFFGKPCFAKFRRQKRTVHIIDTFAFFTMGLGRALEMIGAETKKLEKPKGLGKRIIPLPEIRPYLNNDCRGVLALLEYIKELHQKYETRLCVSLPQLSSRIFRHFYLAKDFPIPSRPLLVGSLLSYHGGKNSFNGGVGWHQDCYDLDINSAYPEAMAQLPNFENGKWRIGSGRKFLARHPHGIYRVSGTLSRCPWGVLFDHGFKKLPAGKFKNIWTTGYEINEALRARELVISKIDGYGFAEGFRNKRVARGAAGGSAFKRFVAEFYAKKEAATNKAEKYFYKLILNSLYGKFIQRTPDEEGNMVAGSMFDPAVASLITGYVRAKIHSLEHRYKAIHTATDGFITKEKPCARDLGPGIGKLKAETFGPVLILRNKLYLHFDKKGQLKKAGLHGFEGDATELEKMWKSSKRIYSVTRLVKWAESWHIGLPPGTERTIQKQLNVARN